MTPTSTTSRKEGEINSGQHTHECTKRNCFYCYEINRNKAPRETMTIILPPPTLKKLKPVKIKQHRGLNGCERLILFANIGKKCLYIADLLPNHSLDVVRNNATLWRKKLGFPKLGNEYLVPWQLR